MRFHVDNPNELQLSNECSHCGGLGITDEDVDCEKKVKPSSPHSARLIARLDIKMSTLIKGVHCEGWRKLGDPDCFARRYYDEGADELIFMDVVASLYNQNNLSSIVRVAAEDILIPITVGGGVRTLSDAKLLFASGADKVAINTAATKNPNLLTAIADYYGSQATVLSIEAKRLPNGGWEAMTDNGRNRTGRDVVGWAVDGAQFGAGEILLTSVDQDGTLRGTDLDLAKQVCREVSIPVIVSGGIGTARHVVDAIGTGGASAVAIAKSLHERRVNLSDVRSELQKAGIRVRTPEVTL